jgi:hypothetical protein
VTVASFTTLTLTPDDDRAWFLDHGTRHHRLRRDGSGAVVSDRSGRSFRLDWPTDEPLPQHEGFAAQIFRIAKKTKAADSAFDDLR